METVLLGSTGIKVSRLGIGLAEIGQTPESPPRLIEESAVKKLLNTALDQGINFFDTAACYGNSEELLGNTISHRRNEFTLATKCGHVTAGYKGQDWTPQTITDSIERSLIRMNTDYLDLVQLHSCDINTLEQGDVINALIKAKEAGKTRFIGYSGDNEYANWAANSRVFDTLQTSFNLVDQKARHELLGPAHSNGLGIIIKRPIANGVWGKSKPASGYGQQYLERAQAMTKLGPIEGSLDPIHMAMGFVFAHPEINTAIIGTTNVDHLLSNIEMLNQGITISSQTFSELTQRFSDLGENWRQLQ